MDNIVNDLCNNINITKYVENDPLLVPTIYNICVEHKKVELFEDLRYWNYNEYIRLFILNNKTKLKYAYNKVIEFLNVNDTTLDFLEKHIKTILENKNEDIKQILRDIISCISYSSITVYIVKEIIEKFEECDSLQILCPTRHSAHIGIVLAFYCSYNNFNVINLLVEHYGLEEYLIENEIIFKYIKYTPTRLIDHKIIDYYITILNRNNTDITESNITQQDICKCVEYGYKYDSYIGYNQPMLYFIDQTKKGMILSTKLVLQNILIPDIINIISGYVNI